MVRKQAEIPGFERQVKNPAVEEAAEAFAVAGDAWSMAAKKRKQKQLELHAIMRAHNVSQYEYIDEAGEVVTARIKVGDEKVVIEKNGDAESTLGEGTSDGPDADGDRDDWPSPSNAPDVSEGLINNALKDDAEPTPAKVKPKKPASSSSGKTKRKR